MARIFSNTGTVEILPTRKKTYQGLSKNTKFCKRGSRPKRKAYRGQGKR